MHPWGWTTAAASAGHITSRSGARRRRRISARRVDLNTSARRALDVARLDQSKGSLTAKLKRAGWDDDFMLKRHGGPEQEVPHSQIRGWTSRWRSLTSGQSVATSSI
jgi:hypothetical protein